VTGQV